MYCATALSEGSRRFLKVAGVAVAALTGALARAEAQTDYYNTDRGRPIRIEDAYPTERHSLDAHLAPIRLERSRGGIYNWGIDPEVAYGILPRTQLELGLPLAYTDLGASRQRSGVAGLDLSVLHNLNAETTTLPALGVRLSVLLPVGSLAPDRAYWSAQGMVTRTFTWARFHANAEYTSGASPDVAVGSDAPTPGAVEVSRWLAGAAVDRTLPIRSMLLTAELFARRPIDAREAVEWNSALGIRQQLNPYLSLDGGIGKRLTGSDQTWFVTFGVARVFAIPLLMARH
jgi:hypothetical protein